MKSWRGILVLVLMNCGGVVYAAPTVFNVNSTADQPDALVDGTCATAAVPPACTLRAAIQEANATVDDDLVNVPAGKYTTCPSGHASMAAWIAPASSAWPSPAAP